MANENAPDKGDPAPVWLVVAEAAARARVGPKTIYREVRANRLKAARVGGRRDLRFKVEWIDRWLEERSTPVPVVGRDGERAEPIRRHDGRAERAA